MPCSRTSGAKQSPETPIPFRLRIEKSHVLTLNPVLAGFGSRALSPEVTRDGLPRSHRSAPTSGIFSIVPLNRGSCQLAFFKNIDIWTPDRYSVKKTSLLEPAFTHSGEEYVLKIADHSNP